MRFFCSYLCLLLQVSDNKVKRSLVYAYKFFLSLLMAGLILQAAGLAILYFFSYDINQNDLYDVINCK